MLTLSSIMIGTMQVKEMGEFYTKVFGREADMKEGDWYGWQMGDMFLTVGEHSEMEGKSKDHARVMFVFTAEDVKKEFDRIKEEANAEVIKEPYEMGGGWIATFADLDGNYFQLMTPWEGEIQ